MKVTIEPLKILWDVDEGRLIIGNDIEVPTTNPMEIVRFFVDLGLTVIYEDYDAGHTETFKPTKTADVLEWVDMKPSYERACEVIQAMHRKPWWRVSILNRKPWRRHSLFRYGYTLRELWNWLTVVHDCKDPAVGCSCSGGYRFP